MKVGLLSEISLSNQYITQQTNIQRVAKVAGDDTDSFVEGQKNETPGLVFR